MAVFRVEKTKDFTVMSNHHLRNVSLSLKAKGLLSLMLSLPDNWDYTTKGLAHICKDGVDSISSAIKELEKQGYHSIKPKYIATTAARAIRYQPKILKSCFLMKDIRKRIDTIDTKNATNIPVSSTAHSIAVKCRPKLMSLIALAPNMTGTAIMKVNSAAATLDTPIIRAPMIVAPDRDVPGNIAAIS